MRLVEYNEGSRGKKIDKEEAFALIERHCSKAWKHFLKTGWCPMRGMRFKGDYYSIDPKSSIRTSQNTVNFYTLAIDNDPRWKRYPKRSQSLVCTNNKGKANQYGEPYRVFAYDNSVWGVCPKNDLWDSFTKTLPYGMKLGELNYNLEDLLSEMNIDDNITSYKDLLYALDDIDHNVEEAESIHEFWERYEYVVYDNELFRYFYNTHQKKPNGSTFKEMYLDFFDPNLNGFFYTKDPKVVAPRQVGDNEVWTDGKAIMVSYAQSHYERIERIS